MNAILRTCIVAFMACVFMTGVAVAEMPAAAWPAKTYYRSKTVNGHRMFYREAGDLSAPAILLLHGYPSSSHTYRELIPLLSGRFHVIAPDNLGSGYSDHPDMAYTFDVLAAQIAGLVKELGLKDYTLYMQDFGAPVGYRLLAMAPEGIKALVIQNANAYMAGLTEQRRAFFKNAHEDKSSEGLAKLYDFTGTEAITHKQYLRDVKGREEAMSPDSWTHDLSFLQTEKNRKIQVQLFQDYYNNLLAYPKWQAMLREKQLPALIVWGKNDPAFIAAGAEAYLRDLPKAELHLLDAGHFAAEEQPVPIAIYITDFMNRLYAKEGGK